jgi:hypothetical protein
VEGGEDRPLVAALDLDAVRVHRHVARAHRRAQEEHQRAEDGQAGRQRDDRHGEAHEPERHAGRATAAEARGAPAGDRHRDDRADRAAGQREAELAVGEADVVAHGGDARRPRAEDQAVEEEDGGHRAARLARGPTHACTTSMPRSR